MSVINFCSTVKNRTWQLKQTLPANIQWVREYNSKGVEVKILLLNYNSEDDLETYLFNNYSYDLEKGYIKYFVLQEILDIFHMSLAKNLIHSQAKEGVLFNLDADNFINNILINELITLKDNQILLPYQHSSLKNLGYRDTGRCGRIGVTKNSFNYLQGYDESIKGLGADDGNFVRRALRANFKLLISKEKSIPIPNKEESLLKDISLQNRGKEAVINSNYLVNNYKVIRKLYNG